MYQLPKEFRKMYTQIQNSELVLQSISKKMFNFMKRMYVIFWHELSLDERVRASPFVPAPENEHKMSWNVIFYYRILRIIFLYIHIFGVLGLFCCIQGRVKIATVFEAIFLIAMTYVGVLCGAHLLWTHTTYQGSLPLRVFLLIGHTLSAQNSLYTWVRDHRLHHKFSDTSNDPHDSSRGMFFSHIGWLLVQRSPQARKEVKKIWMEDMNRDKMVMFHHRYYIPLVLAISFIIPPLIPWYFWNEKFFYAINVTVGIRLLVTMNVTFFFNSLTHKWGPKPFDKGIKAADNKFASFLTGGEGSWHNYHHVFPWDYRAPKAFGYGTTLTSFFIESCAQMGWAYNLKTTSLEVINYRRKRTGDLSYPHFGWNDANLDYDVKNAIKISYKNQSALVE